MSTPGIIGILALQCLASAAVVAYFRRRSEQGMTQVVAALATLLLGAVTALLMINVAYLTNASPTTNLVIILVPVACFVIGLLVATYLKRRRPEAYLRIGGEEIHLVAQTSHRPTPAAANADLAG